ncbi:MAG TPA: hypothetical protein VND64_30570 [Pirellulales bacterium]|nr:hypothetical protein [Pirellulales bacterium]
MSPDAANELVSFHRFIAEHVGRGETDLSPEEALDLWRAQNPSATEFEDTVAALREALNDMEAGDKGTPLESFDRDFRNRRGIPSAP